MTFRVLILCTHNSARSILGEAMLRHLASQRGADVVAYSAGSAPSGRINPLATQALEARGIDTADLRSKSWDEFSQPDSPVLHLVITVCDSAAAEVCPVFHAPAGEAPLKVHWGYPDPSRVQGSDADRLQAFELTRQAIGYRMMQLLALPLETSDRDALAAALAAIGRA